MAMRLKDKGDKGDPKPSSEGAGDKFAISIVAYESRRRAALARGQQPQTANDEARILKDALLSMEDDQWWSFKFELVDGFMEWLHPYLEKLARI